MRNNARRWKRQATKTAEKKTEAIVNENEGCRVEDEQHKLRQKVHPINPHVTPLVTKEYIKEMRFDIRTEHQLPLTKK